MFKRLNTWLFHTKVIRGDDLDIVRARTTRLTRTAKWLVKKPIHVGLLGSFRVVLVEVGYE